MSYEDLRFKTKFGLVNAISHIWQKRKVGERLGHIPVERRREGFVISSPCNKGQVDQEEGGRRKERESRFNV